MEPRGASTRVLGFACPPPITFGPLVGEPICSPSSPTFDWVRPSKIHLAGRSSGTTSAMELNITGLRIIPSCADDGVGKYTDVGVPVTAPKTMDCMAVCLATATSMHFWLPLWQFTEQFIMLKFTGPPAPVLAESPRTIGRCAFSNQQSTKA